jgi:hypothetical protein
MHGLSQRARRQQTMDMAWGGALALGLPILTALAVLISSPGKVEEKADWAAVFGAAKTRPAPPLSRELAQEQIKEIRRVYEENYRNLYLPRLRREEMTSQQRVREYLCAEKTLGYCQNHILKGLRSALEKPDSEIRELSATVGQWEQTLAQARTELDRLNPFPAGLRGPATNVRDE